MGHKLRPLLLTPGPVPSSPAILKQLSKTMIHHRSPEFTEIFKKTRLLLKRVFQTRQEVLILNTSGTGAMSAALLNTLSPGDQVLTLSAGKFGERWGEMARAYKLKVWEIKVPYGEVIPVEEVCAALKKHPKIKAVLAQACETSTGVLHPIRELASLFKKNSKILFILDSISALGAVDIPMDRWGIDVMIGGSQKSFCLPAGMSFIVLSKKAWRFNKQARLSVYYLNLKKELKAQQIGQTAFSTNVSFVHGLLAFLLPFKKQGELVKRIQHCERLSKITLDFCKKQDLKPFATIPSPSLTSIALPEGIDGVELNKYMREKYQLTVGGGQGSLRGKIIRIGHIGQISEIDLKKALKYLSLSLKFFGHKHKKRSSLK